ncbi:MAG: iron chaperone [Candidatus Saccharimonadaceae bacterium]
MSYQQSQLVDKYISQFGDNTKERLNWLRSVIQATFPSTIEDLSYGMPAYRPAPEKRGIVFFAASKGHIGIYGVFEPSSNAPMHAKMKEYRTGKGTLQFKNDEPLPKQTIRQILAQHSSKQIK